jgi:TonB family protein
MKTACGPIREWLGAFADKELDQARADQVSRHLEACADCRRELDQIVELSRLTKSVERPRLAEDYWDWQRTRVWHGIRKASRRRTPAFRPSFGWARLATVAAGAAVVLVVVISGWRTFMPRPGTVGPVGALPSELKKAPEAPVARTSGGEELTAADEKPEPAADVAGAEAEGRADELSEAPVAAWRDAEKLDAGYAGKGAGATRTTAVPRPAPTPMRRGVPEMEVAAQERGKELASAPRAERRLGVSSERKSRIVSGPVLLESPPLPDVDALDTGTVLLNVKTDSAGRVLSAAVRRTSGSARLDSLAVRQIRQSRFTAAVRTNRKVPSSFQYPFRLQKKQAKSVDSERPPADEVKPGNRDGRQEDKQPDKQSERQSDRQSEERSDKQEAEQSDRQEDSQPNRPVKEKTKK